MGSEVVPILFVDKMSHSERVLSFRASFDSGKSMNETLLRKLHQLTVDKYETINEWLVKFKMLIQWLTQHFLRSARNVSSVHMWSAFPSSKNNSVALLPSSHEHEELLTMTSITFLLANAIIDFVLCTFLSCSNLKRFESCLWSGRGDGFGSRMKHFIGTTSRSHHCAYH